MIYIVGLGVDPERTTPIIAEKLKQTCELSYLDTYTTKISEKLQNWLKSYLKAEPVGREVLESTETLVNLAKERNICIYVYGDPYIATTHQSIRLYAERYKVEVKTIYASSFVNAVLGETGLHIYKLGFVGSMLKGDISSRNYVYKEVGRALELGKHSLIITSGYEGDANALLNELIEAEKNFKEETFSDDRFLLIVSKAGTAEQKVIGGCLRNLSAKKLNVEEPFTLVVPGNLHFSEEEILQKLINEKPKANVKESEVAIKAKRAIEKCKKGLKNSKESGLVTKYKDLFENAELYLKDAEKAYEERDYAFSLMQAAYAEGLIDALRFLGESISWE